MILYFTGTGNSRHVANKIAKVTGDPVENIADHLRKDDIGSYHSNKPYVFYRTSICWPLSKSNDRINSESTIQRQQTNLLCRNLGRNTWITAKYTKKLADEKHFEVLGFRSILMPQSYITGGLSTPDAENKKILLFAEPKIDELAPQIKAGEKIPEEPLGKSWMSGRCH